MFSITVPARFLRTQDVRPRLVPVNDRYGHVPDTVSTGDLVDVGPDRTVAIFIGLTPAGCVWVTTDALKVEPQRAALARLWARMMRTIPGVELAL